MKQGMHMAINIRSRTYKRILIILLISFEVTLLLFAMTFFGGFRHLSVEEIDRLNAI